MITLGDLYNADRRVSDARVAAIAQRTAAPHPLTGVDYADGAIDDTTAGHVRCVSCMMGRPCPSRRDRRAPSR